MSRKGLDVRGLALGLSPDGSVTAGVALLARCTGVASTSVFRWIRDPSAKRGALADATLKALDALHGQEVEALGRKLAKLPDDDVLGPVRATLVEVARLAKKG